MANVVTDLGNAIEAAFKADADLRACCPDPLGASAYAIEYGVQRSETLSGAGRCFIRAAGTSTGEPGSHYSGSTLTSLTYDAWFELVDVQGRDGRLAQCLKGVHNALANNGEALLDTHFNDAGNNRLGKSGRVSYAVDIDPLEVIDPDRPVVRVVITIELWLKEPTA